ncbi:MliC family protein [Longimicrobium terrae]|uniref:Membrane-bound inhibitor of C-type lysozyme n=1 Tax=Longimicrobium terrae TaxID=1639882 RepID=A0A841H5S3_9BACT|nr:MliC family protein [Longimicrobium terrae]MBB4639241.1 membrane-bound inhibitor of C-type lysozyme [Longimicrobium terrae]MBB6073481.1 membrane-bound inhibitor of C-type lysozyme [Longimicrobium terrae]NNC32269.1 MliC family protein [Longimicrobium terrae]
MAALTAIVPAGCARTTLNAAPQRDASWVAYQCESGREVTASYPDESTARVRYQGATIAMNIALSASGARYTGGGYEWWTRGSGPGSTGRLSRFAGPEQTASEPLEECSVPAR